MSFNNYHEIYQNMIRSWNARMFYESTSTLEHHYQRIENITSKTAKEFYDSLMINDKNDSLIFESHEDVQFSKALINRILIAIILLKFKHQKFSIDVQNILEVIMK